MKTIKLNSFAALQTISQPEKFYSEKWQDFLARNGHTPETFAYLPDHLKLSLKISFSKKRN